MKIQKYVIIIALFNVNFCFCFIEYIGGLAAAAVGSYVTVSFLNWNHCTQKEIPANFNKLETSLRNNIFGQPLVINTVVKALKAHWDKNHKPHKALAMSFHGGPGVGKNYVAGYIESALYSESSKNKHVHKFIARLHFPEESHAPLYRNNLRQWITGNVTKCPRQLFIFDEVNIMPEGVLDAITPFLDYHSDVNGVNYREAIFIFLSNTGTQLLNQYVYELWKRGKDRNDMKLQDFEKLIAVGSFNEKGGFQNSHTIKSNLIDHYVPFLPLMEPHVRQCIQKEFQRRGKYNYESEMRQVLDSIDYGPEGVEVFAKTGCKRISQQVALFDH